MGKTFVVGDKQFVSGKFAIFNPVPTSEEEAVAHGNALAASGNYPVGTSGCFNVGISGGCGLECFVYLAGECHEPSHAEDLVDAGALAEYYRLYGWPNLFTGECSDV